MTFENDLDLEKARIICNSILDEFKRKNICREVQAIAIFLFTSGFLSSGCISIEDAEFFIENLRIEMHKTRKFLKEKKDCS